MSGKLQCQCNPYLTDLAERMLKNIIFEHDLPFYKQLGK